VGIIFHSTIHHYAENGFRRSLGPKKGVLRRAKEKRNIPRTIKRRKANWIGRILLRLSLLNHVTAGKKEEQT
jgi:hypothetical protein